MVKAELTSLLSERDGSPGQDGKGDELNQNVLLMKSLLLILLRLTWQLHEKPITTDEKSISTFLFKTINSSISRIKLSGR